MAHSQSSAKFDAHVHSHDNMHCTHKLNVTHLDTHKSENSQVSIIHATGQRAPDTRLGVTGQQATTSNSTHAQRAGQQATAPTGPGHITKFGGPTYGLHEPAGQQAYQPPTATHSRQGQQATQLSQQGVSKQTLDDRQQAPATPAGQSSVTEQTYSPDTTTTRDGQLTDFLHNVDYPYLQDEPHTRSGKEPALDTYDIELQSQTARTPVLVDTAHSIKDWPYPSIHLSSKQADMYEAVRLAGVPNHEGPRITMETGLNIQEWEASATGHIDDKWILDAIQFGFPIQYVGPACYEPQSLYNHASALNHPHVIREYIRKETAMGALHGPFPGPPFTPWTVISPMMTREKPDSTERRVIVDLSYPDGGVNKYITPHVFNGRTVSHNLPTIEDAVLSIATMCPGEVHLAVIDLSRAYRQFPVPPADWPLLAIHFEGSYYFDGRIPFGARLSSYAMQSVAQFIIRAMTAKKITAFMYLDDILLVSAGADLATKQYRDTQALLRRLGLQVAVHKLQPPARIATWLGIRIDLDQNAISIPPDKLRQITKCLAATARRTKITVRHMQSIIGFINHLSKVVRAARTFIARLLAALRASTDGVIQVTKQVKADLAWFSRYLKQHNARAIIPHGRTVLRIWADSSLQGGGATDGKRYYAYKYPPGVASTHHITQLEAVNVLAAVRALVADEHAGGVIEVYCDNSAAASSYSSGRARDPVLAACCRAMWYKAAATQTTLTFAHVPGTSMILPDALSRAHFDPTLDKRAKRIVGRNGMLEVRVSANHFAYTSFM